MYSRLIHNHRRTIGLLMDNRWGSYSEGAWTALNTIASEKNINLVLLPSETIINKNEYEYQFNLCYNYIENQLFDGIIILSSIVRYSNMHEHYAHKLNFLTTTPTISIGSFLPGALSSILIDNKTGIREAMTHLITHHHLTKIACITGPAGNQEAIDRFDTYKEMLLLHHIPVDPSLIVEGDFFIESGITAGKILYEERNIAIEAIICANDAMAIGFMQYCIDKNISIPNDVKIIGFDNVHEIQFLMSPLASIEQPYEQISTLALELLTKTWAGIEVEPTYLVESHFISRTSCGCIEYIDHPQGFNVNYYNKDALLQFSQAITYEGIKKIIVNRQMNNLMLEGIHNIMSPKTQTDLLIELPLILSKLNIKTCLISLFNPSDGQSPDNPLHIGHSALKTSPEDIDLPQLSSSIFCYQQATVQLGQPTFYDSNLLIPPEMVFEDRHHTFILEPLFFNEELFGIILFELGLIDSNVYETIRRHLSNAIKLHTMFDYLKSTQKHLVQSEKMAALGTLVAGVAHEINTPIGIGITAASFILDQTNMFKEKLNSNQLTRKELADYTHCVKETTNILFTHLQKASSLITGFKNVSADQIVEDLRLFDLVAYTHQIKNSLMPETKKHKVIFIIEGDDSIEALGYPGTYAQIMTNLIMNTLLHGIIPERTITIQIQLKSKNKNVYINYTDNGKGIPDTIIDKIFDPFFTTQKGTGGTGLGLNIVYNTVTQKLKGTISCQSTFGQGATFKLSFPLIQDSAMIIHSKKEPL